MDTINFEAFRRGQEDQAEMSASLEIQQASDDSRLFAENAALLHQAQQQRNNLTFTTQDAAQRSVIEVLARHNTTTEDDEGEGNGEGPGADDLKRKGDSVDGAPKTPSKKLRSSLLITDDDKDDPAAVAASTEGLAYFHDNDVLSGRGGGTNVHPCVRSF